MSTSSTQNPIPSHAEETQNHHRLSGRRPNAGRPPPWGWNRRAPTRSGGCGCWCSSVSPQPVAGAMAPRMGGGTTAKAACESASAKYVTTPAEIRLWREALHAPGLDSLRIKSRFDPPRRIVYTMGSPDDDKKIDVHVIDGRGYVWNADGTYTVSSSQMHVALLSWPLPPIPLPPSFLLSLTHSRATRTPYPPRRQTRTGSEKRTASWGR